MEKEIILEDFLRCISAEKVNQTIKTPIKGEIFYKEHKTINSECDYERIIESLNGNSTVTKIKVLDKLLDLQLLETKQDLWEEFSETLRAGFVSQSNDVFVKTLKIHQRIISIPNTCLEGYLNLLKSTILLLNSRYSSSRAPEAIKLIIETQKDVVKILLHSSHSVIDEIITAFANVLTFKSIFDVFGSLDPYSTWLKYFCYGAYIKTTFFQTLTANHEDFIKDLVNTFNEVTSPYYTIFFLNFFQHNSLSEWNSSVLELIIKRSHANEETCKLFAQFPSLLTPKFLSMFEPLNRHVIEMVTNIAKSTNFRILFQTHTTLGKCSKQKLAKSCRNLPQKIVDATVISLQSKDSLLLLKCCTSIYKSHSSSLIHTNPAKLLRTLQEFHRSVKNDMDILRVLLPLFEFFLTWYRLTLKVTGCDTEILNELLDSADISTILARVGGDKAGFHFVKTHKKIVKPYLEKLWLSEDIEDDCADFLLFLAGVGLATRTVVALLSDDDDGTVVESDKSLNLGDLMEKCLDDYCESDEEYLGLVVIKSLIKNLDLLAYLQANYQMQEKLMKENGCIVDAQSTLKTGILFSLENVGFPDVGHVSANKFREFLEQDCGSEFSWLLQAKRTFKDSLDCIDHSVVSTLLEKVPKTCVYRKSELQWPPSDSVYYQLHPEDFSGIIVIIKFGQKSGLLTDEERHKDNLVLLIKQARAFIRHQPEHFSSFDWFVGIIFLISLGDFDQSKENLINFAKTQVTSLIWTTFGKEFDETLQENFYLHLNVVLQENTQAFEALKMLHLTPEFMVQSWLNQCFFNYLEFNEICTFLAFAVLYPVECLLYYLVTIFQHITDRLCTVTYEPTLENIFTMTEMSDFRLSNNINAIEKLIKRYRNTHKL